jgi:membrane protease YdiL (CAAX protease family)
MSVVAAIEGSAFLSAPTKRERTIWRAFVSLVGGLVAGLLVAMVCGVIALLAFLAIDGDLSKGAATIPSAVMALIGDDGHSVRGALFILVLAVFTNGPLALTFMVVASAISARPIRAYVSVTPRPRWRLLATGLLLSMAWLAVLLAIDAMMGGKAPTPPLLSVSPLWTGRGLYAIATVVLLIPAAAAEEIVFRGWMLRQTGVFTRNVWVLMAVNGLVFSAIHGDFSPDAFLTRAIMGAGFVYMTLRMGGIEFSTGAHAANNIMIVLLIQPLSLKTVAAPEISAGSILEDLFLIAGYVLITELVMRWRPLRRLAGVGEGEPAGAPTQVAEQFN